MKFYIAARTSETKGVQEMIRVLVEKGYTCTHDWTTTEGLSIQRPFINNAEEVSQYSEKDILSAKEADFLIIMGDVEEQECTLKWEQLLQVEQKSTQ